MFGGDHGWGLGEGDVSRRRRRQGGGNRRRRECGGSRHESFGGGGPSSWCQGFLLQGLQAQGCSQFSKLGGVVGSQFSKRGDVCGGLGVGGVELPLQIQRCILASDLVEHLLVDEIYCLRIWAPRIIAIIIMARCRDPQTHGPGTHARSTHWCEWRGVRNQVGCCSLLLGMQLLCMQFVVVLLLPFEQLVADRARREVVFISRLLTVGSVFRDRSR